MKYFICGGKLLFEENSKEVQMLRLFRDNCLLSTKFGRKVSTLYYNNNDLVIKFFKSYGILKPPIRLLVRLLLIIYFKNKYFNHA